MLSFITAKNKTTAVNAINYPVTFDDLEHFLRLTRYLKLSVYYYTQVVQLLQDLKITLFKSTFVIKAQQKTIISRTKVPQSTDIELALFTTLKKQLFLLVKLVHFSADLVF